MKLSLFILFLFSHVYSIQLSSLTQQKPPTEELLLVIEVTRHGAREPSYIFNFTQDPDENFKGLENLTPYGKKQHFDLGNQLRQRYIEKQQFISNEYLSSEVEVQSTSTNRTYLSSIFQLMGLFPNATPSSHDYDYYNIGQEPFLSQKQQESKQKPETIENPFKVFQESLISDLFLHLSEENCPRYNVAFNLAKTSEQFQYIVNYFIRNFQERLSTVTNTSMPTYRSMYLACSYIQWAGLANMTLKFNLTDQDKKYCQAVVDSKQYCVSYGDDELWKLGGYEWLNRLYQVSQDLKIMQRVKSQTGIQSKLRRLNVTIPKFIMYLGHEETLSKFMDAIGLHHPQKFDPASGIFLEFYKTNNQIFVRLLYYFSMTQEFDQISLSETGSVMDLDSFIEHINERLQMAGEYDIRYQCFQTDFTTNTFYSGVKGLDDLLKFYGISPVPTSIE